MCIRDRYKIMEAIRNNARTLMGSVILGCGLYLLVAHDASTSLPKIFSTLNENIGFFNHLIPFSFAFFKINAMLFTAAGLCTLFDLPYGALCYSFGFLMFGCTYDNPFLAKKMDDKFLKCLYLMCHGVLISTLFSLKRLSQIEKEEDASAETIPAEKETTQTKQSFSQSKIDISRNLFISISFILSLIHI
eukprot:TRINITY_DN16632_c0_g1_i1.p1 TRINITY_DN16632_c0_g1~~TRINITY_DN16632_c0_g1_i1.p1  ORF type:complete len:205 (-),score=17.09 TRINITY_DN16632_c0_g1_i1:42-611(-)